MHHFLFVVCQISSRDVQKKLVVDRRTEIRKQLMWEADSVTSLQTVSVNFGPKNDALLTFFFIPKQQLNLSQHSQISTP